MIIVYGTHCPKCNVVEMKLKQLGREFKIIDDPDTVIKVAEAHGFRTMPVLQVEDSFLDFSNAVAWINEQLHK